MATSNGQFGLLVWCVICQQNLLVYIVSMELKSVTGSNISRIHNHVDKVKFACQFLTKLSMSLIPNFKVKIWIEYTGQFIYDYIKKHWQIGKKLLLPTRMKLHVTFRMAYLHLTLPHSKGQDQVHFNCEYVGNGDRYSKRCYCKQMESRIRPFH